MEKKKRYEAYYAGYTYEKPVTYWTPVREAASRLTRVDPSQPGPIAAGGMPVLSDGGNIFLDDKDGHTAVIAASGMKKSICCFMPLIANLARAGENMVITDPKGELYQRTSGFLENLGYRVLCLDFRAMDKDRFNILRYPASVYRDGDHDKGLSLLSDITNALMEDQKEGRQDPFWANTAVQWLNGTGALMLDAYPDIRKINVLNWSDFNTKITADMVMNNVVGHMPESTVTALLRQVYSSADRTLRSVLITASSALGLFNQNPRLSAMLSDNTFCLEDLTDPKTALYLVTDDTTSTVDPILGILISQIQSFLVDQAFGSEDGKLETRMNFVLDEFGSIPVPNMDKALATHRSRNIRYYLCIQSLAQMRRRYPEPEALLANCASTLYLGSTEPELLEQLETKLGRTRITPDGSERPLCSQAELMTLEKAWDHKEAIYMNLSEGIRCCTMLPSIEAYGIGDVPAPLIHAEPPAVQMYDVCRFVWDFMHGRLRGSIVGEGNRREKAANASFSARPGNIPERPGQNEEKLVWTPKGRRTK